MGIPVNSQFELALYVSSAQATDLIVEGLVRRKSGETTPFSRNLTTTGDRTTTDSIAVPLEDGELVSARVFLEVGQTIARGTVFARVYIAKRDARTLISLIEDYVYGGYSPSWPSQTSAGLQSAFHGLGNLKRINLVSTELVAAGNVLFAVPSLTRYRIVYLRVLYTATATAGSRNVRIRFRDGSANVLKGSVDKTLTASQTGEFLFAPFLARAAVASNGANAGEHDNCPEFLDAAYDMFIEDTADIDVTAPADTVLLEGLVEEFLEA